MSACFGEICGEFLADDDLDDDDDPEIGLLTYYKNLVNKIESWHKKCSPSQAIRPIGRR